MRVASSTDYATLDTGGAVPTTNGNGAWASRSAGSSAATQPSTDTVEISHAATEAMRKLLQQPGNERKAALSLIYSLMSQSASQPDLSNVAVFNKSYAVAGASTTGALLDMAA